MKLYFNPGVCSLGAHITLHELGLPYEAIAVDIQTHKTIAGQDYYAINPLGYVPALLLENGELLTESSAILPFLADLKPAAALVPRQGTLERYRLQKWLHFIATEIHKQFRREFDERQHTQISQRFDFIVATTLNQQEYLLESGYSVADAYFYGILTLARAYGPDFASWPTLQNYFEKIKSRPAVIATLAAEREAKKHLGKTV